MTPADGGTGELLYRGCDFGEGVTGVVIEATGEGVVELSLDGGPSTSWLPAGGAPDTGLPPGGARVDELPPHGARVNELPPDGGGTATCRRT